MRFSCVLLLGVVAMVCGCQSGMPLFNGKDLTGWVEVASRGAWSAENGILTCSGEKDGYAWLSTDRKYGDFELTLECRLPEEGNSGVFLRAPAREGRISMTGFEVQMRDDRADTTLDDVSGAVFRRIAASGKYSRPIGQWNDLKLTMRGRRLRIELNGRLVSETDIDQVVPQGKDPAMKDVPNEGFIGLQNHAMPVEFRNVRIRPLKP